MTKKTKLNNLSERFLAKGKELFEKGEKHELLYCLDFCIRNHVPIPTWLAQAFCQAYDAARFAAIKSWDQAFDPPQRKSKQLNRARHKVEVAVPLYFSVVALKEAKKPIDFTEIGKEFNVGATLAKEIYYSMDKEFKHITSKNYLEDWINRKD